MRYQLLSLLLLAVAGTQSRRPMYGGRGSTSRVCAVTLKPTSAEMIATRDASFVCVGQQFDLQVICEAIKAIYVGRDRRNPRRRQNSGVGVPRGRSNSIAGILEYGGYITEATTLRECIARETGRLDASGAFDDAALQDEIRTKVSGLAIEANTLLGIANCGTVVDFDLLEYMECIRRYCVTGGAR